MINTDIEVVLIEVLFRRYKVVVSADVESRQRRGKQCSDPGSDRIDGPWRNDIRGHAASSDCHRKSAHATRKISARSHTLREMRIENFSLVSLVAVAVENVLPS